MPANHLSITQAADLYFKGIEFDPFAHLTDGLIETQYFASPTMPGGY